MLLRHGSSGNRSSSTGESVVCLILLTQPLPGTKLGKLTGTNDAAHETEPITFTGSLAKSSHSFIWSAFWYLRSPRAKIRCILSMTS